jgi:AbrB family looped-hinge helix DNA binding protein
MSTVIKKGQVTIPKTFREHHKIREGDRLDFEVKDNALILKTRERKSLLNLGGIAQGRKVGSGNEREYAKKSVAKKNRTGRAVEHG